MPKKSVKAKAKDIPEVDPFSPAPLQKVKWWVTATYHNGDGRACYYPMAETKGLAIELAKVERQRISSIFGLPVKRWTARLWTEKDEADRLKRKAASDACKRRHGK